MTNDEILTEIVAIGTGDNHEDLIDVLGAVLNLHTPFEYSHHFTDKVFIQCKLCYKAYPCATIQAIERELA
jgi:hypothetical protein